MIQPENYINEQKLIEWLKVDLETQREELVNNRLHGVYIEDETLTLNIGIKNDKSHTGVHSLSGNVAGILINFNFDLKKILIGVDGEGKYDGSNLVCPYIVNCNKLFFDDKEKNKNDDIINFSNITFNNKIYFSSTVFKLNVFFMSSVFMNEVDFYVCNFELTANFQASSFNMVTNFISSKFVEMASFYGTTIKDKMTFDNITFGKSNGRVFFRNINDKGGERFQSSEIEIKNTIIDWRIDFNNVHISKFRFENSSVISGGVISRVDFEPYIENSDTAIIFKHEELARSNTIKALKYKAIEKDRYYDEIKKGIITKFLNIFKTKNKKIENKKADQNIRELFAELTSLWLSKSSNNHGQNWFLAVAFIIAVSFIFLSLASFALMSISWFYIFLLFYLLVLLFSIYKNNHLVNIVSTVIISVIIYRIFSTSFPLETVVINTDKINVMNLFITGYVNYLTPTNLDLINGVAHCIDNASSNKYLLETVNQNCSQLNKLNPIRLISFYFFYILGKIAIGYGIFQVIQAFRKFNIK